MVESAAKKATAKVEPAPELKNLERNKRIATGQCVVENDPTPHVGRAVNGLVCSAHAMHYLADGTPRAR